MSENITVGIGRILGHDGNAVFLGDGRLVAVSQKEAECLAKKANEVPHNLHNYRPTA